MNCILISSILIACIQMDVRADAVHSNCSCGIFDVSGDKPLIEHTLPIPVSCDEKDVDSCLMLCTVLAQSGKENANSIICEKLNRHMENLKITLYHKSCGNDWKSTGMQSEKPFSCHDGKEIACNSA